MIMYWCSCHYSFCFLF